MFFPGTYHAKIAIVDPELIIASPADLTLGGIADIFCACTATTDWELTHEKTGEKISPKGIQFYKNMVESLMQQTDQFIPFTEQSVKKVYETFLHALSLCGASFSDRPVEGAEHFLSYCIEEVAQHPFIHGEIIALTILIVLRLQGDRRKVPVEAAQGFFDALRIKYHISEQNLSREILQEAIMKMPHFLLDRHLPYCIFNEPGIFDNENSMDLLLNWIENL